MNATYNYKTGRNNITFDNGVSKKGNFKPFVRKQPAHVEFSEKCLTFIDMILEFICSARVIVGAKALFSFVTLLGFLGIIGGIEIGTVSLLTGVACLSLIIALEFVILRDEKFQ